MTASFHFGFWVYSTSLTPRPYIEVHLSSQESEWSYVRIIEVASVPTNFFLGFGNVPIV